MLVVAVACVGFTVLSASSARGAGAAVVHPHALDGAVTLSLSVTGVVGEGGTGGPGSIQVDSFQWGVAKPASTSGASTGKVKYSEFSFTKKIDSASPTFFKNCVAGAHYPKVVLFVRKAGEASGDSATFTFTTVFVTSVSWSGDDSSGIAPVESITMAFKNSALTYSRSAVG
jgi:type VI secretion system Hcp family effector